MGCVCAGRLRGVGARTLGGGVLGWGAAGGGGLGLGIEHGAGFGLEALVLVGGCRVAGLGDLAGVLVLVVLAGRRGGIRRSLPGGGLVGYRWLLGGDGLGRTGGL